MTTTKRFLAGVIALLSIVGVVACGAGVVGAWWFKRPLLDQATKGFQSVSQALEVTGRTVDVIFDNLRKARADLGIIKERAATPIKNGQKPTFFDRMTSRAIADQLGPKVRQVHETVNIASDAAVVLNSLLGGLDQLPLGSVTAFDTDRLGQVQDSLTDFTASSQKLGSLLELSAPDGSDGDLAETTVHMEEVLDRVIEWTAEFRARVDKVRADVAAVKPRTLHWIRFGPIVITAVLGWFTLAQLSLFAVAIWWFKRLGEGTTG